MGAEPAGDAYVELHIEPHPFFRRKDDNVHVDVPVTLKEAWRRTGAPGGQDGRRPGRGPGHR